MFIKLFSPIILFFGMSCLYASVPTHLKTEQDILNSFGSYNSSDYAFAQNLVILIQDIEENIRLDLKTIRKLKSLTKQTIAFNHFGPVISFASELSDNRNHSSKLYSTCSRIDTVRPPGRSKLVEQLLLNLEKYCSIKTIFGLRHQKISSTSVLYLRNSLKFLSDDKYRSQLINLFSNLAKTDARKFKHFSNIVTGYHIANDIAPENSLTLVLKPSNRFKKFIFKKNAENRNRIEKRNHSRQFSRIYTSAKKLLKKDKVTQANKKFEELEQFFHKNQEKIFSSTAWKRFLLTGNTYLYRKKPSRAKHYYNLSLKLASTEEQKSKTIFQLLWSDIVFKNFKNCIKTIKKHGLMETQEEQNTKIQFWMAYTLQNSNRKEEAIKLFEKIIEKAPLSYYSLMTLERLTNLGHKHYSKKYVQSFNSQNSKALAKYDDLPADTKHLLQRISIWIDLNQSQYVDWEISSLMLANSQLKETDKNKLQQTLVALAELLTTKNQHLPAFKIISQSVRNDLLNMDKNLLSLYFPFRFFSQIEKKSKKLDPILVLSLIRQESAFNPKARSIAGAKGLMQIMPATARQYHRKKVTPKLMNPSLNLKIGMKVLKSLLKKYDNDIVRALAAYNAGQGKVKRWNKQIFNPAKIKNPLLLIESIPYDETRLYVKLILRNIFFYKLLDDEEKTLRAPEFLAV